MPLSKHPLLQPKKKGQRRLLALDGGGIRGLITVGILEKLETDLRTHLKAGDDFRLSDYFDFIGGTSTGAILSAGLSREMRVSELLNFYKSAGAEMFKKNWILGKFWNAYRAEPLKAKLQQVLGPDTTLGSEDLKTLVMLVMRNHTTDSPWPLSNNPLAKYNDKNMDYCNLNLPLWQLVRASTAAPVYFPPEVVNVGKHSFVFVDGGVTPYNNPAFMMYRMATSEPFKLNWTTGEDKMLIVSIGTGAYPNEGPKSTKPFRNLISTAINIAPEMMNGMAFDQDANCRTVGRCVFGEQMDRELGDMVPNNVPKGGLGKNFIYTRYNPMLTKDGLENLGLSHLDPKKLSQLDSVDAIEDLLAVGRSYADINLKTKSHLQGFI